eukprot:g6338.t1
MKMMAASRSPEKVEVNGDPTKGRTDDGEEDTLSKARKAAKVHLNALKEHMEEAMEAFNRLDPWQFCVIFTAAEAVKTERDELRRAREQLELERRQLKELKTQQVAQAQAAHTVATHAVAAGNVQVVLGPKMGTRRNACAAVRLDAQRLLIIGGSDDASELDSTEVLDLERMVFSPGPRMGTRRNACAASLIDHHRLLVIGGSDGCSDLESTELLDLMLGTCPQMSAWRSGCTCAPLGPQQLLVVGGFDGSNHLDSTELLDLKDSRAVGTVEEEVDELAGLRELAEERGKGRGGVKPPKKERDLSEFVRLVSFSGLLTEFQGDGPFTAMIPNDYAFALLGDSVNNLFLPENSEKLKEEHDFMPSHNRVQEVWKMIFLRYHVVVGKFLSIQLTSPQDLNTLQGGVVSAVPWTQLGWTGIAYQSAAPPVVINERAQVVTPDILATNGVVHIIDHVLFPPGVDLSFFDTTQAPLLAASDAKVATTTIQLSWLNRGEQTSPTKRAARGSVGMWRFLLLVAAAGREAPTVKVHLLSSDDTRGLLRGSAETLRALEAEKEALNEAAPLLKKAQEEHVGGHEESESAIQHEDGMVLAQWGPAQTSTPLLRPPLPLLRWHPRQLSRCWASRASRANYGHGLWWLWDDA